MVTLNTLFKLMSYSQSSDSEITKMNTADRVLPEPREQHNSTTLLEQHYQSSIYEINGRFSKKQF